MKTVLENQFYRFKKKILEECENTNLTCLQKVRVGHIAKFLDLCSTFPTKFISSFRDFTSHLYFQERLLSIVAYTRARSAENPFEPP